MPRWLGAVLMAAAALLFLIANRGAYEGYFHDDDLDNLSWTRASQSHTFAVGLVSPVLAVSNFRPTGHLFYRLMGATAGLEFRWYVAAMHALHLLNVWLVWLLARRLGAGPWAASAGALFFAFHMAAFDAYWKPMYIFDVLCGLFVLLCLLAYSRRRYLLALAAFWLAYKSKEVAVMLPAVLAAYELWLGERRWKPLVPFFLISLSFGLQALFANRAKDDAYTLRFSAAALWTCLAFYSSKALLAPYAGLALPAAALSRDRRVYFGLAGFGLLLAPLLFLPGRLFSVYLYVPLAVGAVALAALADRCRISLAAAALFFVIWIPWNHKILRENRRAALTVANENRAYVAALAGFAPAAGSVDTLIYDGAPGAMNRWGVEGALKLVTGRPDLTVYSSGDDEVRRLLRSDSIAILSWDPSTQKLLTTVRRSGEPEMAYIHMGRQTPLWQLDEGWFPLEQSFRWIKPRATASLHRPSDARQFEVVVNIGPGQIRDLGRTEVRVLLDGAPIGRSEFTRSGWQNVRWELPPAAPGPVKVEFQVVPEYRPANRDPRTLGIPIGAFGFPPLEKRDRP